MQRYAVGAFFDLDQLHGLLGAAIDGHHAFHQTQQIVNVHMIATSSVVSAGAAVRRSRETNNLEIGGRAVGGVGLRRNERADEIAGFTGNDELSRFTVPVTAVSTRDAIT
jgi:hypothetical protein